MIKKKSLLNYCGSDEVLESEKYIHVNDKYLFFTF